MGLVLDTSVVIRAERLPLSAEQLLERVRVGDSIQVMLAAVSVVELTHGIYRAKATSYQERRKRYLSSVLSTVNVAPLTLPIAQLAGRIEGEQAAIGNTIDLADLLIAATALYFSYGVATYNEERFRRIPGLRVVVPAL